MSAKAVSANGATPALKLFEPITVGPVTLQHRVVLAPLTRFRADINHVPLDIVKTYYEQRASTPGQYLKAYLQFSYSTRIR